MTGMPQPGQAPWPGGEALGHRGRLVDAPAPDDGLAVLKDAGGEPGGGGLLGDRRKILLVVHLLARVAAEVVEGGGFRVIAAFDHPLCVLDVEVEPPEAVDAAEHPRGNARALERGADFEAHVAAFCAVAVLPVADEHGFGVFTDRGELPAGEGAQHVGREDAHLFALRAEAVGRDLGGVVARAEQEEQHLRVVREVAFGSAIGTAGELFIFREDLGNRLARLLHREVELELVVDDVRLVHIGADRDGMREVEGAVGRVVFPDERLHVGILLEHLAAALLMARKEAVERDDDGQLHPLGELQRADVEVVDRLRGVGEEDDPAGVEGIHDVAVVPLDRQRPRDGAAGDVHDHREARARLDG